MDTNPTAKVATPLQYGNSFTTPVIGSISSKGRALPSSTKLAHLSRQNSVVNRSVTQKPATPNERALSVEDKRRGMQQALADEKKKKNDEKMRQVIQAREALEKEKMEKHLKILQVFM